jgi:malate dehydrogenase
MSRTDLLKANADIVRPAAEAVKKHAPNAYVVVVTNPLDVMAWMFWKVTGFPKQRVLGMAGILDSTRFRAFLAMELNVSGADIQAMVLGGHGDSMVPIIQSCTVAGIPVTKLIPKDRLTAIVERTKAAGGEVVALLKTGSAFVSPALSAVEMAEAILKDKKRVLACASFHEGEYGVSGLYIGVPCVLGAGGVERVLEVDLNPEERKLFDASVEAVRSLVTQIAV